MSYYEHFEVFFKVLSLFRDILKYERMTAASNIQNYEANIYTEIDCCNNTLEHTVKLEPLLKSFYEADSLASELVIALEGYQKYIYPLSKREEVNRSSATFLCPFLFASLSLESFYEVLCSIYLEQTVIFISDNLNILTSSM
jgi:hypothetical protein